MPRRNVAAALCTVLMLASCGERRDLAEVAAGMPPFDELRGFNILELRGGQVRALRRNIERAPGQGYRERIGAWDIVYASRGYDGADGSWPQEEVQILEIEAAREYASDALGRVAWAASVQQMRNVTGTSPRCLAPAGAADSLRVAEFDRGDGWHLVTSIASAGTDSLTRIARHTIAVRRTSLNGSSIECPTS